MDLHASEIKGIDPFSCFLPDSENAAKAPERTVDKMPREDSRLFYLFIVCASRISHSINQISFLLAEKQFPRLRFFVSPTFLAGHFILRQLRVWEQCCRRLCGRQGGRRFVSLPALGHGSRSVCPGPGSGAGSAQPAAPPYALGVPEAHGNLGQSGRAPRRCLPRCRRAWCPAHRDLRLGRRAVRPVALASSAVKLG